MSLRRKLSERRLLPSLPLLLAIGVIAINLFVIAVVAVSLHYSRQQEHSEAEATSRNLCQVLEQNLVGTTNQINLSLLAVKNEAEQQLATGRMHGRILEDLMAKQFANLPDIDALRVADEKADEILGTDVAGGPNINLADRSYFRELRDHPEADLVTSEPLIGRRVGKWIIIFARRINRPDGSFAGITYASVTLEHLTRTLALVDAGKNGVIILRNLDMVLLARYPVSPVNESQIGQTLVSRQFRELFGTGRDEGTYIATSALDGLERTFSFRRIYGEPFFVVVGLATSDYLAEWRREATRVWTLVALFCLSTVLAAAIFYYAWKRWLAVHEALHQSEARLSSLIHSQVVGVLLVDGSGNLQEANAAFLQIVGYTPEDLSAGLRWRDLTAPEFRERDAAAFQASLQSGAFGPFEKEYIRKDGSRVPVLVSGAVYDQENRRGITLVLDLSELKKAQAEITRLARIVETTDDAVMSVSSEGRVLSGTRRRNDCMATAATTWK